MALSTIKKTAAGLCLAGLFLLFASAMAYQSAKWSLENSFWVSHTHEVLDELDATQADLAQSRTASREYLTTGDSLSLREYHDHLSRLELDLDQVAHSTADNGTQQEQLSTLRSQIKNATDLLDQSIALRQRQGFEAAGQLALIARARELADSVEATIH
ncbi:MAG TPA: CHASE3 domain-containing protein, partial [Terriglobales bacterium]|nr:CHASE3 domain-containing protein [Terriglobales bacterium]